MKNKGWLEETEEFFFQGVRVGWAGGNNGHLIDKLHGAPGMEDWREILHTDGLGFSGFSLADRWGLDPDYSISSGSISIIHYQIPVWGMWYGGDDYNMDVVAFLRRALMQSYGRREFCGGRGPVQYREGDLLYTNEFEGNFARFSGHEYVEYVRNNGEKQNAGSHRYWGGSFIYRPCP